MIQLVPQQRARRAHICSLPAFDAYLVYYPPGLRQPEHQHRCSQFSALLAGSLTERVGGRIHEASPGQVSAKPKGIVHSDSYGPNGAAVLSFHIRCGDTARETFQDDDWRWRSTKLSAPSLSLALRRYSCGRDRDDILWDVLAAVEPQGTHRPAPDWLRWVRSMLERCDHSRDIGFLAAQAGVHRVHLSRQFVRSFGLTPSAYRSRQMVMRALRAMVDDKASAAGAAHDAGFADQSHMTRAIRSAFGITPGKLAALFDD